MGASASSDPTGPGIDLLRGLDPQTHGIRGKWERKEGEIVTPGGVAILTIPFLPPRNYRWTVVCERTKGDDSLGLVLAVGPSQTMVVFEGWHEKISGLNLVSGLSAHDNPTTCRQSIFLPGACTTIVCTVLDSTVTVACDGKTIIDWSGSLAELSLDNPYGSDIPLGQLALAVHDPQTQFRITRMELERLGNDSGQLAASPPQNNPPPSAAGSHRAALRASGTSGKSPTATPETSSQAESALPEAAVARKASVALIEHPLGTGTGFTIGHNMIVTNAHVVAGSFVDEIQIDFSSAGDQRQRPHRILYENELCDLCILEVDTDQPTIPVLRAHTFQPDEPVVLIGNPSLGGGMMMRNAVTDGTITALMRIDGFDFYQMDANINPGSSGGPVLNDRGELVAVVAMKATDEGQSEIRAALQKLDESFAARFKQPKDQDNDQKGIAYGVPVSALCDALEQVAKQDDAAADQIHTRHLAHTLFERMSFLCTINLLAAQANVPASVRQQARELERSGLPPHSSRNPRNKPKYVRLMPPQLAEQLADELQSERVRKLLNVYEKGLDDRLSQLRDTQHSDANVNRRLTELQRLVTQSQRAAKHPPDDYSNFSQTLLNLDDNITDTLEKTSQALEDAETAAE